MTVKAIHRKIVLFLPLVLLCTTTSCSRVPQATSYPFSTQHKMQSVDHWNILAEDTANQLNQNLITKMPDNVSCVYVKPVDSTFGKAFGNLLKSNLLEISSAPTERQTPLYTIADNTDTGCIQVDFSTQVIKHREDRIGRLFPGTLTFLTSTIAVMRDFEWYAMLMGAGIVGDIVGGTANSTPHNEVLITTKITSNNSLLSMRTDMYYINDLDTWHYEKQKPMSARQFNMVGRDVNEL